MILGVNIGEFHVIDYVIVLLIALSAAYAAWRGFMSETLSIFAWAAAGLGALYFGPWLLPLVSSKVETIWLASLLSYAAVFLAIFVPLAFISRRFSDSVKRSPIGPLDRALGLVFGAVRGLAVLALAYMAFSYYMPPRHQPAWLTGAQLMPLVQKSGEVLLSVLPASLHKDLAATLEKPQSDSLGALIQRENAAAEGGSASLQKGGKTYGAEDRRALDTLIRKQ